IVLTRFYSTTPSHSAPSTLCLHDALPILHSGLCDVVLAYHGAYRLPWNTGSAIKDPFRRGSSISGDGGIPPLESIAASSGYTARSEEHTSELQSLRHLVCRLLLEKKKNKS